MLFVRCSSLPQSGGLLGPFQHVVVTLTDRIYTSLMISARRPKPDTENTLAKRELLSVPRQLPIRRCHTASRRALEPVWQASQRLRGWHY